MKRKYRANLKVIADSTKAPIAVRNAAMDYKDRFNLRKKLNFSIYEAIDEFLKKNREYLEVQHANSN